MNAIPIWALFAGTIVVLVLCIEIGYRAGGRAHKRSAREKESPVAAMSGAVLGLTAFMLAFTFGVVYDRFDDRKALVRDDAAAIRTAYLRADFLPDSDRGEAKALLRKYLDDRLALAGSDRLEPVQVKAALDDASRIHARLWAMAVANARRDMNSDVAALYIDSLNQMHEIHAARVVVGLQARIPLGIWLLLDFITILGMLGMGYQAGIAGSKRSLIAPIAALSFAIVIGAIASLDRPDSDLIRTPQTPLTDLRQSIASGALGG
jgi:hypothetical protein